MRKIVINENQLKYLFEETWNFHHGSNHDGSPYRSENKYMCYHETGQFGSGTYFSTYRMNEKRDWGKDYDKHYNPTQTFIQINDNVYRVDFDIYKNLYRVSNEQHGDVLHTMMGDLNSFYHKVSGCDLGRYNKPNAKYDNAWLYQRISSNAKGLGLKCPNYLELTRMAQRHAESEEKQSFSTVFMEYNGYNGVNVSYVPKFDNSRHGSVIYDLSKTEALNPDKLEKVPFWTVGQSHTNTIASEIGNDAIEESLVGKFNTFSFNKLNNKQKLRVVKNLVSHGYGFTASDIKYYLTDVPHAIPYVLKAMYNHVIDEYYTLDYEMKNYIVENKFYQFINFIPKEFNHRHETFLIKFLDDLEDNWWQNDIEDFSTKQTDFNNLMSYLKRPLTEKEKNYLQEYFSEFFKIK